MNFPSLPTGWRIDAAWRYDGTWHGAVSRGPVGDEVFGKILTCDGGTPYEAVSSAVNELTSTVSRTLAADTSGPVLAENSNSSLVGTLSEVTPQVDTSLGDPS